MSRVLNRYSGLFVFAMLSTVLSTIDGAEQAASPRPAWATSKVTGSPLPPEPFEIVASFPQLKFKLPTSLEEFPTAPRLLVTEMGGKIYSFSKQANVAQADLVADLDAMLSADLRGKRLALFDAEFHPQFVSNRHLIVCYVHPGNGGHTRVSRLTLTKDEQPKVEPGSEQVLITWPSGGHNAGCLEFGPDGYLYIATGDGSGPNPPDGLTTGQDVSDLLGSILRIDVDKLSGELAYSIPADNPFVGKPNIRAEIWAYGLRNPWKFGIDRTNGQVFVADNGWESWEMIHRADRGTNCGWPVMEGRAALRSEVKVGPTPIVPPVMDHSHTEANSVIGGPVYRGSKLADLNGAFVYGDYITGTIWGVKPDRDGSYSCTTLIDTDQRIVGFLQGSQGELYVLDYDLTGQIYELRPSNTPDTSATFPRRLSATGLFQSLSPLAPADGVVPYSVVVPRWDDGAESQRWVAIPGNGKIELAPSAEKPAVYPEGTVLVKHLTLPQGNDKSIPLETQLLHYERGTWRPYSYLWDEAGREATLVDTVGTSRPIKLAARDKTPAIERTWHVNATNECKLCHNAGPKFVLGFVPNQLTNSASSLAAQAVLLSAPPIKADDPLQLVDPHDHQRHLDDRARSYLHANCSMCHHPGGNAIVSFFLRRDLPFEQLNTNKGTGIGTFGMRDAKIIVPGDPYRSVLMYRMTKLGYARMPYIGSRVVDSEGVALIEQWILSLGNTKPNQHSTSDMNSTEDALALALQLHSGKLIGGKFTDAVKAGSALAASDRRGLFETFVPESQRRPTLGPTFDPQIVLSKTGDAARGRLIFFSDGARCRNCHEADDRDKSLGPTLLDIKKKYPRTADMLPHVLQPSLKIDEPFAAYTAVLADGRVLSGLLVEQNDQQVVLKTPEKRIVRLLRANIEELVKSTASLMPERILSDLTAQEAADLLEYIRAVTLQP